VDEFQSFHDKVVEVNPKWASSFEGSTQQEGLLESDSTTIIGATTYSELIYLFLMGPYGGPLHFLIKEVEDGWLGRSTRIYTGDEEKVWKGCGALFSFNFLLTCNL